MARRGYWLSRNSTNASQLGGYLGVQRMGRHQGNRLPINSQAAVSSVTVAFCLRTASWLPRLSRGETPVVFVRQRWCGRYSGKRSNRHRQLQRIHHSGCRYGRALFSRCGVVSEIVSSSVQGARIVNGDDSRFRPHGLQPVQDRSCRSAPPSARCRAASAHRTASFSNAERLSGLTTNTTSSLSGCIEPFPRMSHTGRSPTSRRACPNPCVCRPAATITADAMMDSLKRLDASRHLQLERTPSPPKVDRRLRKVKPALRQRIRFAFQQTTSTEACPSVTDNLACCLSAPSNTLVR